MCWVVYLALLRRLIEGGKGGLKGFRRIYPRNIVGKIVRKLSGRPIKNNQKNTLKLLPKNWKSLINQSAFRHATVKPAHSQLYGGDVRKLTLINRDSHFFFILYLAFLGSGRTRSLHRIYDSFQPEKHDNKKLVNNLDKSRNFQDPRIETCLPFLLLLCFFLFEGLSDLGKNLKTTTSVKKTNKNISKNHFNTCLKAFWKSLKAL